MRARVLWRGVSSAVFGLRRDEYLPPLTRRATSELRALRFSCGATGALHCGCMRNGVPAADSNCAATELLT